MPLNASAADIARGLNMTADDHVDPLDAA
jgi:hypothetical protein